MTEEKIIPCKCGNMPIAEWVDSGKHNGDCHYEIRCDICHITETGPDHGPAIAAWNKRIEGEKTNSNYAFIAVKNMIENKKIEVLQHAKIELPLYMAEMLINKFLSFEEGQKQPANIVSPAKDQMQDMRNAVEKLDLPASDLPKKVSSSEDPADKPRLTQSEFEKLQARLKAKAAAEKSASSQTERPEWADSLEKVQGRRLGRPKSENYA